jgi:hypothetical protein
MSQLMGAVNRTKRRRMWLGLRRAWLLQTVTFTMLASCQLANLGTWLMWLFLSTSGHCLRSQNYFSLRLIGASEEQIPLVNR